MGQSTHGQTKMRVEYVRRMILAGDSYTVICQNVSAKYGISEKTVAYYITKAKKIIEEDLKQAREDTLAEHVSHRRYLRSLAHGKKDYKLELEIVRDEAKLLGLYTDQIQSVNIDVDSLTDEQVDRILKGEPIADVLNKP